MLAKVQFVVWCMFYSKVFAGYIASLLGYFRSECFIGWGFNFTNSEPIPYPQ